MTATSPTLPAPDLYLEIAGRGTGKTYRLIGAICEWLRGGGNRAAIVHTMNMRSFKGIMNDTQQLEPWMKPLLFYRRFPAGKRFVTKSFYDDFDWIGPMDVDENTTGYFTTSIARQRTVDEMCDTETTDPLLKLIRLNGGKYVHCPASNHPLINTRILADARTELTDDVFEREFLAKLIA